MPGYIKVDGDQRPVASPYIKVNGTWTPVALGYTKVNGEWKIWHSAEIVDNFNRANNATLGTASNDFSTWTTLAGTWGVSSNTALAGTTAGPHIASVPLYKATPDVTVEVDIPSGTGVGAAFWVQNATNWWAAIPGRRTQNNPSFYSCPSGYTPATSSSFTTCTRYEEVSTIVPSPTTYTAAAVEQFQTVYSCSSGALEFINGQPNCRYWVDEAAGQSTTTVYSACPSGYFAYSQTQCRQYGSCVTSTTTSGIGCRGVDGCANAGGSCQFSQTCADLKLGPCNCVVTSSTSSCSAGGACDSGCSSRYLSTTRTSSTVTSYTCPPGADRGPETVGGVWVCRYRTTNNAWLSSSQVSAGFACSSATGYSVSQSGGTCTYTSNGPYCPSGYQKLNANTCYRNLYENSTFNPATTTYPSVVRIWRNVGGVVTQVNMQDLGSDPRSIQVSTSGNNISVKAHSSAGVSGNPYRSIAYTASNPARSTIVGIAKNGNQAVSQANAIDNFRAE